MVSLPLKPRASLANLSSDAIPSSCSSITTPACVLDLYGIPAQPATQKANLIDAMLIDSQIPGIADIKVCAGARYDTIGAISSAKLFAVVFGQSSS